MPEEDGRLQRTSLADARHPPRPEARPKGAARGTTLVRRETGLLLEGVGKLHLKLLWRSTAQQFRHRRKLLVKSGGRRNA